MFIKPDKEILLANFSRMDDCYYTFLKEYSAPSNSINLLEIREKIIKILLYAIYWRVGGSLSDEKFRADYKNELQVVLKQLNQAVSLID